MAISLYDISVACYLQSLGAVTGFLDKGSAHASDHGIDLDEVVATSLYPDMLPFHFQIVSVAHHSLGAMKGLQAGVFAPPPATAEMDYAGLRKLVADARDELAGFSREAVDALEGKDVVFEIGERKLPFTAENFVTSFSLPNVHFHAATAYDILRMKGVPLGKRDYLGALRMN